MDRLTRHDLKTDKFVEEVGQTVHYVDEHRKEMIRYGGIALAVIVLAAGGWYFYQTRKAERQTALAKAVETYNAPITATPREGAKSFATKAEKDKVMVKELNDLATKYSGTGEGAAGTYMLGLNAADEGKLDEAERYLKRAAEDGGKEYGSLAKLSLAQLYAGTGRVADAEKLLRGLIDNPTMFVAKDQATLTLARILSKTKPDEAKKLLEPLRTANGPISRIAIQAYTEVSAGK
ncbi:tetratricopeptide repeat protein [uncultured Paludibaculum sp.]|uniref:tetratricopeptide repeat protein n=1 Tax=uncultured Paludibaculum sp. TaxID=1765020 RepID=UPI002AABF881|nr:tetratricopeptide repeat protein [uncultured Paludibaculum sp.]